MSVQIHSLHTTFSLSLKKKGEEKNRRWNSNHPNMNHSLNSGRQQLSGWFCPVCIGFEWLQTPSTISVRLLLAPVGFNWHGTPNELSGIEAGRIHSMRFEAYRNWSEPAETIWSQWKAFEAGLISVTQLSSPDKLNTIFNYSKLMYMLIYSHICG